MENRTRARNRRRLAPGQIPDPLKAHGAWVYLVVSILVGVSTVSGPGQAPALLAGGGFVGVFVLASALAVGGRRAAAARIALGLPLTVGSGILALHLGADQRFLVVGLLAVPPVVAAAYFAGVRGFLAPGALAFGVVVLAVSAPVAASAGGASPRRALLVLAALATFFFWRTWRLARVLGPGWTKERFQRRGLLESVLTVVWAAAVVVVIRLLA